MRGCDPAGAELCLPAGTQLSPSFPILPSTDPSIPPASSSWGQQPRGCHRKGCAMSSAVAIGDFDALCTSQSLLV